MKSFHQKRFYGVVVSTLDFESSDLGSTPGRTFLIFLFLFQYFPSNFALNFFHLNIILFCFMCRRSVVVSIGLNYYFFFFF
jgi:hypothetical protein